MASKPHSLGPWKRVLRWLYHQKNEDHMPKPKRRSCALCEDKRKIREYRVRKCIENVNAAILEGKRQRLIAHLKSKGQKLPDKVRRKRSDIALYESRKDIPQ
jgi:hypothetical protein